MGVDLVQVCSWRGRARSCLTAECRYVWCELACVRAASTWGRDWSRGRSLARLVVRVQQYHLALVDRRRGSCKHLLQIETTAAADPLRHVGGVLSYSLSPLHTSWAGHVCSSGRAAGPSSKIGHDGRRPRRLRRSSHLRNLESRRQDT